MKKTFAQLLEQGFTGRDIETVSSFQRRGPVVGVEPSSHDLLVIRREWVATREPRKYSPWSFGQDVNGSPVFVRPDQSFTQEGDGSWVTYLLGGVKLIIHPEGKNLDVGNVLDTL